MNKEQPLSSGKLLYDRKAKTIKPKSVERKAVW